MNISGYNVPEPCYGIGAKKLVAMWIAQRAAGMLRAADQTKIMRRELQEAANVVASENKNGGSQKI
jgi:hypothetical protein